MNWVRLVIDAILQLFAIQNAQRISLVVSGLFLSLIAIIFGSTALLVFGGAMVVFGIVWRS